MYNIGGGRGNSCSIHEAFARVETLTGKKMPWEYVTEARKGDHICYISNLAKMRQHYGRWDITKDLDTIFQEIVGSWSERVL